MRLVANMRRSTNSSDARLPHHGRYLGRSTRESGNASICGMVGPASRLRKGASNQQELLIQRKSLPLAAYSYPWSSFRIRRVAQFSGRPRAHPGVRHQPYPFAAVAPVRPSAAIVGQGLEAISCVLVHRFDQQPPRTRSLVLDTRPQT
jgi:hypothetical protein